MIMVADLEPLRFPVEVFEAMRATWPTEKPMSVRVSEQTGKKGLNEADLIEISETFAKAGCDLLDCSLATIPIRTCLWPDVPDPLG